MDIKSAPDPSKKIKQRGIVSGEWGQSLNCDYGLHDFLNKADRTGPGELKSQHNDLNHRLSPIFFSLNRFYTGGKNT